jgi:hypothetical protein
LFCGLPAFGVAPEEESPACAAGEGAACGAEEEAALMSQELLQVGLARRHDHRMGQAAEAAPAASSEVYTGHFKSSLPNEKDVSVHVEFDSVGGRGHVVASGYGTEEISVERDGDAFKFSGTSTSLLQTGKAEGRRNGEGVIEGKMSLRGVGIGTFALKPQPADLPSRADLGRQRHTALAQSMDASVQGKEGREQRLCDGQLLHLYHQTTMEACPLILATGFRRGKPGLLGAGIYFCEKKEITAWKALHWGCMVEVLVQVGHVKDIGDGQVAHNGQSRDLGIELGTKGYDSMTTNLDGIEWAVYYKDQVVDMIAYPCEKDGTRNGTFVNDRDTLNADKVPASCPSHTVSTYTHATGDQSADMNADADTNE